MLEVLITGEFGPIRFGVPRSEVLALLGEPDDVGGTSRRYRRPAIWKYGDLEFHFGVGQDRLELIFADDFRALTGGAGIALDPWKLRGGAGRVEISGSLEKAGVRFSERDIDGSEGEKSILVTQGGVELRFLNRAVYAMGETGLRAASIKDKR